MHELLMALLGHTGSVIVNTGHSFALAETIDFLSRAERDLIDKIVALGWAYKQLLDFVESATNHSTIHPAAEDNLEDSEQAGVYIRAVSYGIDELLKLYREHILAIEHEYLAERALTIPHVIDRLSIFFQLFPALSRCVASVSEQRLKGGQLLDALSEYEQSGNPAVRQLFGRVIYHCLCVLYDHINAWAIYGIISDDCEEFFIQRIYSGEKELALVQQPPSEKGSALNMSTASIASLGGSKQPSAFGMHDVEVEEWNTAYKLRLSMLPTNYVTPDLAEKILFIGKVVRVLQSKNALVQSDTQLLTVSEMQVFSQAFHQLQQLPNFNAVLFAVPFLRRTY